MADIRDFEGGHSDTKTTARPSYKVQEEARLHFGKAGREAEKNSQADVLLPWAVTIFGRRHGHNFHTEAEAQATADLMGGTVIKIN